MWNALPRAGSICVVLAALLGSAPAAGAAIVDRCPAAGARTGGWCGDGGPATQARLSGPRGVAPTADGGLLIADTQNNVVRRVSRGGIITRIAGIGLAGHTGDGGPATAARLDDPQCISETPDGSVLVQVRDAVRRISHGTITTVDGADPCRPALLPDGSTLVVEDGASQVERVGADGTRTVVAGTGECGSIGDGGPATAAQLALPRAVAALAGGGFVIADTENNLIRRVTPDGIIETVAGREPPVALACGASGENDPPNYLVLRRPLTARVARPLEISITSTNAGRLTLTITKGRRVFGPLRRRAREGVLRMTIRPRLRRGTYTLTVTNRGTRSGLGGETTTFTKTDRAQLTIRR
ncbi:MAG: hypothetical protein QOE31_241 [Solirubrobacteraceae bacterium]|nr:hypothetical protein [Solirubrobacteraceae bacterium]